MIEAVITAARRLMEALSAENEALARLDLPTAGELARGKRQAADAFEAAFAAAHRSGTKAGGAEREAAERIALRLRDLTAENRRLLERAIDLQSRVIETIAGAAKPAAPATYGVRGRQREGRAGAVSVLARV